MGKKWLTETEAYNIITQCDVVRDTLANSPGDGIYQRFRTFPQYRFALFTRNFIYDITDDRNYTNYR